METNSEDGDVLGDVTDKLYGLLLVIGGVALIALIGAIIVGVPAILTVFITIEVYKMYGFALAVAAHIAIGLFWSIVSAIFTVGE